jgi:hypothetical protein
MTKDEKAKKLMYMAILSQSLIDEIDEEIGLFRFKTKNIAKSFLGNLLELMDKDFGSDEAVSQLIDLTKWHKDMFNILFSTGELSEIEQKGFEYDWDLLLEKYNLKQDE